MDPAGKRDFPDSARCAERGWTTAQGLCPSPSHPFQANIGRLRRPFFSRIGPKPALRPRGEFISAWIRWTTKGRERERAGEGNYQAAGSRRVVV